MTSINVIGLGYIGLPTALMLSTTGLKVIGTDTNERLVSTLNDGELTFDEQGMPEIFETAQQNKIEFKTEYEKAELYIVAVPTPYLKDSKKLDPRYVQSAVNQIMDICDKGSIIVIESTISPGSVDKYVRPEITKRGLVVGEDIHLAHAPERIIPGKMIYELQHNSRTIGVDDKKVGEKIKSIYSKFCTADIIITDIRTAEMSKVIENTYRDINIAFANELTKICRVDNMDVHEIIKIANMHPRVNILQPGPGVGGHCISVDPWFLVGDYPDLTNLILTARKINDSMPRHVLGRIRDIMRENNIKDTSKIGLYGLTYKEDIDDVRESPTLQLIERMQEHLAFGVKVFDPFVKNRIVEHQFMNFEDFLNEIEVVVIMVGHRHLKENIKGIEDKIILDTRNVIELPSVYRL